MKVKCVCGNTEDNRYVKYCPLCGRNLSLNTSNVPDLNREREEPGVVRDEEWYWDL